MRRGGTIQAANVPYENCDCNAAYRRLGNVYSYGCWFHRVVGSGIFLDLGRTLLMKNRQRDYPKFKQDYEAAHGPLPSPELPEGAVTTVSKWDDAPLASMAASSGYATVQLFWGGVRGEVVATTHHACLNAASTAASSTFANLQTQRDAQAIRDGHRAACVPLPGLTTGNVRERCECDADAALALNCYNSPLAPAMTTTKTTKKRPRRVRGAAGGPARTARIAALRGPEHKGVLCRAFGWCSADVASWWVSQG